MENLKIGNLLEVTTSDGIHYERVIQVENEILTETVQEKEDEYISIQGLTSNWSYKKISDVEIVLKLRNYNECYYALKELVEVKSINEIYGRSNIEYITRQPKAWEAAKSFILKRIILILLIVTSILTQAQITVRELCIQLPDVCLDSIQDPQPGEVAYSNATLWYCDGVNWIDVGSYIECQGRVKLGYADWNGEPDQGDFYEVFDTLSYFYMFSVKAGSKVYQGSYIPDFGFSYEKLKQ